MDEVRRGLKMIKNRHNRHLFRARQVRRMEQDQFGEDDEVESPQSIEMETQDAMSDFLIKKVESLSD